MLFRNLEEQLLKRKEIQKNIGTRYLFIYLRKTVVPKRILYSVEIKEKIQGQA